MLVLFEPSGTGQGWCWEHFSCLPSTPASHRRALLAPTSCICAAFVLQGSARGTGRVLRVQPGALLVARGAGGKARGHEGVAPRSLKQLETAPKLEPDPTPPTHPRAG